jgi:dTDP-4-dehydrorhamnose 3,5-epimerase
LKLIIDYILPRRSHEIYKDNDKGLTNYRIPLFFRWQRRSGETIRIYEFFARGLQCNYEESFYSTSQKGVVRGFHFQLPPKTSEKLVWVSHGAILDVVLDLRTKSETFKQTFSIDLSSENHKAIYLPKGMAHAFCVLSNYATVHYQISKAYSPEHDSGVRWNSVVFDWPSKILSFLREIMNYRN